METLFFRTRFFFATVKRPSSGDKILGSVRRESTRGEMLNSSKVDRVSALRVPVLLASRTARTGVTQRFQPPGTTRTGGTMSFQAPRNPEGWWDSVLSGSQLPWGLVGLYPLSP